MIPSLAEIERQAILAVLKECAGNVPEAARRLGVGKTTIYRKLREYRSSQARIPPASVCIPELPPMAPGRRKRDRLIIAAIEAAAFLESCPGSANQELAKNLRDAVTDVL